MSGTGAEALFATVLAEQASRPLVTFYDDASGERTELSARSLANWVAKTHFLLLDELGLGPGHTATVALPADWVTVAILLGCWSAGLNVSRSDAATDVAFAEPATLDDVAAAPEVFAVNPGSLTRSFGSAAAPAPDYVSAVRPQPDAWASVRFAGGPEDAAIDGLTRRELADRARDRARELGLTAGARVLTERPWVQASDWVDALLAPLAVGASIVLVAHADADPGRRQRRIAQEQVTAAL